MCVFRIHVLKTAVKRWYWEVYMVFGSLVVLHVWLHSCLCFSLLKKLFLKASLTPPRHLAIHRASKLFFFSQSRHLLNTWWINQESSCLLDSFSAARSIDRASVLDMLGCSSTLARHLHLSTAIFSTPTSTAYSIPLYTYICRDLLMAYIISSCDPQLISVDLSRNTSVFSTPKPLSLTPIFLLKVSSSFSRFSSLGKLLISHIHAFHVLKPRIWDFWSFFFQIVEFFLKFWDGF